MMTTFEENTTDILQRQYLYTNVANLAINKAKVFDKYITIQQNAILTEILNIETCSPQALDNYWGKIFKITRQFFNRETGEKFNLNNEDFREIIKLRAFSTTWNSCLASLNIFIKELFKSRGSAKVIDNLNMTTLIFSFNFRLKDWEIYLFKNTNILPRPAGVGSEISIIDDDYKYFGFGTYATIVISPITVGFGTYKNEPMGEGAVADYEGYI